MEREEVFALVKNCYNGEPASCIGACPFHLDIKTFLKKAAKGKLSQARAELSKALPFPYIISNICPAPCERNCQRHTVLGDESVSINLLERSAMNAKEKKERKSYMLPLLETKAAVVGAGVGGLCAALSLNRKRYNVTVFEKNETPGGSLVGNEKFSLFKEEIDKVFVDTDVSFIYNKEIKALSELEGFDVIFIATGKDGEDFSLLSTVNKELGTTKLGNVFLGGELLGDTKIEGMAKAALITKAMESFVQTGDPSHALLSWEKQNSCKDAPHKGEISRERVVPSGELYTDEEAAAEAARCMMCDCEECVKSCEFLEKYKKKPPRIAVDVAQDGMTRNSVSSACITRQTWSCNMCGHCQDVCEEGVNIGSVFELSRIDRVKSGNYPKGFHGYYLEEMQHNINNNAFVKPAPGKNTCEYVFFPGCRLGGANPLYVTRSYEALLGKYERVGIFFDCCGIPSLWAGEKDLFDKHIEDIKKKWEEIGCPKVVYACASCNRTLTRFLPEIETVSLYELLDTDKKADDKVYSVFDPCAAAGNDKLKESVKALAKEANITLSDFDSTGKCCGYGGHIQMANPSLYGELTKARSEMSEHPYLVYCANCMDVFRSQGKETKHILDIIFDIDSDKITTLQEKRDNNFEVKKELLEKYWDEKVPYVAPKWADIKLSIDESVSKEMEASLITEDVVKRVIFENEASGDGFINEDNEVLCSLTSDYCVFWVKYSKESDIYIIREAYSHRMGFKEE